VVQPCAFSNNRKQIKINCKYTKSVNGKYAKEINTHTHTHRYIYIYIHTHTHTHTHIYIGRRTKHANVW